MALNRARRAKGSPADSSPQFSGASGHRQMTEAVRAQMLGLRATRFIDARPCRRIGELVYVDERQVQCFTSAIRITIASSYCTVAIGIELNDPPDRGSERGAHVGRASARRSPLAARSATLVAPAAGRAAFRIPEEIVRPGPLLATPLCGGRLPVEIAISAPGSKPLSLTVHHSHGDVVHRFSC